jgi:hypothetical protein
VPPARVLHSEGSTEAQPDSPDPMRSLLTRSLRVATEYLPQKA